MKKSIIIGFSILLISFVIFRLGIYFLAPVMETQLTIDVYKEMQKTKAFLGTIEQFFLYGFNLVVGFFLLYHSKRAMKLLWFALGAVFGLNALILFFIVDLYSKRKHTEYENLLDD